MVVLVKGHILHQRTKFYKDRSNRYADIAIFVIFQDGGLRHFRFSKIRNFNGLSAVWGQYASLCQNVIKIGQTAAKIWRFNGCQNGGRPPSWICEIRILLRSERLRDPFCTSIPNFVKIGQTAAEISRFL